MTRIEHLLCLLAEECAEVAHRTSKAIRFGLTEVQEGQLLNNADRILDEVVDLLAVLELLFEDGLLSPGDATDKLDAKKAKVLRYLAYSEKCGTLTPSSPKKH